MTRFIPRGVSEEEDRIAQTIYCDADPWPTMSDHQRRLVERVTDLVRIARANSATVSARPARDERADAAVVALELLRPHYPTPCPLCHAWWTRNDGTGSLMLTHKGTCWYAAALRAAKEAQ